MTFASGGRFPPQSGQSPVRQRLEIAYFNFPQMQLVSRCFPLELPRFCLDP